MDIVNHSLDDMVSESEIKEAIDQAIMNVSFMTIEQDIEFRSELIKELKKLNLQYGVMWDI